MEQEDNHTASKIQSNGYVKMTKSNLMTLPNELIDMFLIYLSSCEIVQSFNNLNARFNSLIYRFIHNINVTSKRKAWLNKYFTSVQLFVTKVIFNHSQLQTLFPKPSTITNQYRSLQSIVWNYKFIDDNQLCLSYLNIFRRKLSSITLNVSSDDEETVHLNVALSLLQDDSYISQLSLNSKDEFSNMWFSFAPNILKINRYLKYLTIKLHYIHDLFILIENLSVLEYLNVDVCEVEEKDVYNYNNILNKTATLSPFLKEVIMNAMDFTYPRLLLFLQPFQQCIELLTLNMSIRDKLDGEILESTIITKMSKLKQFKFIFQVDHKENVNINKDLDKLISTFRSTSYWSTQSIMCYHDRSIPCYTILSLPWIWSESDSLTNEIMNYRINNTSVPLEMPEIKSIYLAGTDISLEFLKFIKKIFINLRKMIISWHTCTIDERVVYGKNRIKLETIHTLKYYGATDDLEYVDFFLLTPNLRRLVVDGSTIHVINGYVYEDERLVSICKRISHLHIFRHYDNCNEDETEKTFPNAIISKKEF
ncbi:hypothetical protein I4U23_019910 [Adineta vaga]|nr:hypothetical protein I4U23_019910 [Adineta vaga]